MKILKEIWSGYFSQLGWLEIIVYLIAFGCISGFSIAIMIYILRVKHPLSQDVPTGQQQDQYRQIHPMNQAPRQAHPGKIEEAHPLKNFSNG